MELTTHHDRRTRSLGNHEPDASGSIKTQTRRARKIPQVSSTHPEVIAQKMSHYEATTKQSDQEISESSPPDKGSSNVGKKPMPVTISGLQAPSPLTQCHPEKKHDYKEKRSVSETAQSVSSRESVSECSRASSYCCTSGSGLESKPLSFPELSMYAAKRNFSSHTNGEKWSTAWEKDSKSPDGMSANRCHRISTKPIIKPASSTKSPKVGVLSKHISTKKQKAKMVKAADKIHYGDRPVIKQFDELFDKCTRTINGEMQCEEKTLVDTVKDKSAIKSSTVTKFSSDEPNSKGDTTTKFTELPLARSCRDKPCALRRANKQDPISATQKRAKILQEKIPRGIRETNSGCETYRIEKSPWALIPDDTSLSSSCTSMLSKEETPAVLEQEKKGIQTVKSNLLDHIEELQSIRNKINSLLSENTSVVDANVKDGEPSCILAQKKSTESEIHVIRPPNEQAECGNFSLATSDSDTPLLCRKFAVSPIKSKLRQPTLGLPAVTANSPCTEQAPKTLKLLSENLKKSHTCYDTHENTLKKNSKPSPRAKNTAGQKEESDTKPTVKYYQINASRDIAGVRTKEPALFKERALQYFKKGIAEQIKFFMATGKKVKVVDDFCDMFAKKIYRNAKDLLKHTDFSSIINEQPEPKQAKAGNIAWTADSSHSKPEDLFLSSARESLRNSFVRNFLDFGDHTSDEVKDKSKTPPATVCKNTSQQCVKNSVSENRKDTSPDSIASNDKILKIFREHAEKSGKATPQEQVADHDDTPVKKNRGSTNINIKPPLQTTNRRTYTVPKQSKKIPAISSYVKTLKKVDKTLMESLSNDKKAAELIEEVQDFEQKLSSVGCGENDGLEEGPLSQDRSLFSYRSHYSNTTPRTPATVSEVVSGRSGGWSPRRRGASHSCRLSDPPIAQGRAPLYGQEHGRAESSGNTHTSPLDVLRELRAATGPRENTAWGDMVNEPVNIELSDSSFMYFLTEHGLRFNQVQTEMEKEGMHIRTREPSTVSITPVGSRWFFTLLRCLEKLGVERDNVHSLLHGDSLRVYGCRVEDVADVMFAELVFAFDQCCARHHLQKHFSLYFSQRIQRKPPMSDAETEHFLKVEKFQLFRHLVSIELRPFPALYDKLREKLLCSRCFSFCFIGAQGGEVQTTDNSDPDDMAARTHLLCCLNECAEKDFQVQDIQDFATTTDGNRKRPLRFAVPRRSATPRRRYAGRLLPC